MTIQAERSLVHLMHHLGICISPRCVCISHGIIYIYHHGICTSPRCVYIYTSHGIIYIHHHGICTSPRCVRARVQGVPLTSDLCPGRQVVAGSEMRVKQPLGAGCTEENAFSFFMRCLLYSSSALGLSPGLLFTCVVSAMIKVKAQ